MPYSEVCITASMSCVSFILELSISMIYCLPSHGLSYGSCFCADFGLDICLVNDAEFQLKDCWSIREGRSYVFNCIWFIRGEHGTNFSMAGPSRVVLYALLCFQLFAQLQLCTYTQGIAEVHMFDDIAGDTHVDAVPCRAVERQLRILEYDLLNPQL